MIIDSPYEFGHFLRKIELIQPHLDLGRLWICPSIDYRLPAALQRCKFEIKRLSVHVWLTSQSYFPFSCRQDQDETSTGKDGWADEWSLVRRTEAIIKMVVQFVWTTQSITFNNNGRSSVSCPWLSCGDWMVVRRVSHSVHRNQHYLLVVRSQLMA